MNNILIVDDNVENAERIINFLNETDKEFIFYQALNGKVACTIAEKKLPDLIITDWDMPVMDGIELIKHLKTIDSTKDIPIIMCTGVMTESANLKTAIDAGAVDFIRKPVEKLELISRVHSMLKLSDSIKKIKEQNEILTIQKDEISRQNLQLEDLVATKDKFFGIIAHDLKGPFNGILGFSDLLVNSNEKFCDTEVNHFLNLLNQSARNTYKLLENLLEWARSQTGNIEFLPAQFKLRDETQDIISFSENAANTKSIKIINKIPGNLYIYADKNMFRTILRNLITNAVKFTHINGLITISAFENHNEIEITVSDTGIGMSELTRNKLFKINEKTTRRGTQNESGTGLGLLLCKEFVEKHSGKIWVESEECKGSDFKFTLPRDD